MAATAKELREKRAPVAVKMRELSDRASNADHDWSAEDEQEWTRINAEYDQFTRQIEMVERVETVETEQRKRNGDGRTGRDDLNGRTNPEGTQRTREETRSLAMQAWFRAQEDLELNEDHIEACRELKINPRRNKLELQIGDTRGVHGLQNEFRSCHPTLIQRRDLSAVTGAGGAVTVPEGFINSLEVNMLAYGGMLQVADVMRTETGNDLPWPTADDTSNEGTQLGESSSIGDSVDPTFAAMILGAYKMSSKLVKVPTELIEDSAFNLISQLGMWLGERLGRVQNRKTTTGNGAGTCKGVVTAATLGVTAASATAIAADELIDLEHSIDPAYRNNSARYMFHDNILLHLRKLKDGEGRYMFQSNLAQGAADTFNGRPFTQNQHMASSVATGEKTILFGDFSKYKIRQVRGVRLKRLVERYADTDQEGYVAFLRMDGNLLDAGTAPIKYLQQP